MHRDGRTYAVEAVAGVKQSFKITDRDPESLLVLDFGLGGPEGAGQDRVAVGVKHRQRVTLDNVRNRVSEFTLIDGKGLRFDPWDRNGIVKKNDDQPFRCISCTCL